MESLYSETWTRSGYHSPCSQETIVSHPWGPQTECLGDLSLRRPALKIGWEGKRMKTEWKQVNGRPQSSPGGPWASLASAGRTGHCLAPPRHPGPWDSFRAPLLGVSCRRFLWLCPQLSWEHRPQAPEATWPALAQSPGVALGQ